MGPTFQRMKAEFGAKLEEVGQEERQLGGRLGEITLRPRNGNFADDEDNEAVAELEQMLKRRARAELKAEAEMEYMEEMFKPYRVELDVRIQKTRRGIRFRSLQHGKKPNRRALWASRSDTPKPGLPNIRIFHRMNRITNSGGKPTKRLRRYSTYRMGYQQEVLSKYIQKVISENSGA